VGPPLKAVYVFVRLSQLSVAYSRLVSGEEYDEETEGEGHNEKYYDDVDEMRAFMRMFM
jgi:hypothetical protein